jgi:hypothetical protein
MRRSPSFTLVAFVVSFLGAAHQPAAVAQEVMRYIYHPPESPLDHRYEYQWEILRTALERTRDTYGPYVMQPSDFMTEKRQAFELRNATGRLTVMYLSSTPEFERDLVPVRIPVAKNLSGYCVLLIRKEDQPRFDAVLTLDDLRRRFTYGLGLGWVDVSVFKRDGFNVVTGSDYDGLFRMLVNRRFDAFPRSVVEVLDEFDRRKAAMPDLAIEQTLLIYYPLPMYFWFPNTPEGRRLADRTREGMTRMLDDGSYDRIFFAYQGDKIERLHLRDRRIFRIPNPMLSPATPFNDRRLWFDPTTDRVPTTRPTT